MINENRENEEEKEGKKIKRRRKRDKTAGIRNKDKNVKRKR